MRQEASTSRPVRESAALGAVVLAVCLTAVVTPILAARADGRDAFAPLAVLIAVAAVSIAVALLALHRLGAGRARASAAVVVDAEPTPPAPPRPDEPEARVPNPSGADEARLPELPADVEPAGAPESALDAVPPDEEAPVAPVFRPAPAEPTAQLEPEAAADPNGALPHATTGALTPSRIVGDPTPAERALGEDDLLALMRAEVGRAVSELRAELTAGVDARPGSVLREADLRAELERRVATFRPQDAQGDVPPRSAEPPSPAVDGDGEIAWETCEIVWWHGVRKGGFEARPDGTRRAAAVLRSPMVAWTGEGTPSPEGATATAHEALITKLVEDGWERAEPGDTWYGDRFRRRLRAATPERTTPAPTRPGPARRRR